MFIRTCTTGNWGFPGNPSIWGWTGTVLNLVTYFGLIAGLALLVLWVVRGARLQTSTAAYHNGRPNSDSMDIALEIMMNRYAQGEITREQYEQMKQDIQTASN